MRALASLAACLALAGCVSVVTRDTGPTATDQSLPAHALREATRALSPRLPPGSKISVDTPGLTGADAALVVMALEGHRLAVVDRADTDYLVTVAAPVLGTDTLSRVLGWPGGAVPTFHTAGTLEVPEISLWSSTERTGVAELHMTVVDAHSGRLIAAQGPLYGVARIRAERLLTGLVLGDALAPPRVVAGRR